MTEEELTPERVRTEEREEIAAETAIGTEATGAEGDSSFGKTVAPTETDVSVSEPEVESVDGPDDGLCTLLSRGISWVLHPFLVPTYTVLVLLFGDTIMSNIATGLKWFFVLMVSLNTLVIPAILIALMRTFGVLGSLSLQQRRERVIPLAVVAVCYLICALMISNILVAFLIRKFLFAAFGCVLVALVVNFWWKISLHLTAAGGAVAVLLIVAISRFGDLTGTVIGAILLSGLLASVRLWMGSHTPAQVAAGFFGGFTAAALVMLAF